MLRTATEHDVDTIRRLRNQQANREVSITSHEICADEHAALVGEGRRSTRPAGC